MENLNTTSKQSGLHKKKLPIIILGVTIVLLVIYVFLSCLRLLYYEQGIRIHQDAERKLQELRQQRSGNSYINNLFGFSIDLPESWKGYTVNQVKKDIYDVTLSTIADSRAVDSFQLIELHHPLETAQNPRQVTPIMIFTPTQWVHIQNEEWSVLDAPFPPSFIAQNSQWIMALPARYNYGLKTGWEEVVQLLHTLKAFEPPLNNN